ncbi:hypothetical protein ANCDUO_16547 [Ancylostoma duodenale]|uniref:Uncharacterized protein n=1 Tax=Ancylostoma duodenale TaxID=51022 RepID=A0A0C2CU55_9BILA|nr:hypothetical protein ANCDUO_16547 [Ancylostoma duodenale]
MVWAEVYVTSRTPLLVVEKGAKINPDFYLEEVLSKKLSSWSREHSKNLIQLLHKFKKVQRWFCGNLPDFIDANKWPANSPDLNVLEYSAWTTLGEEACAKRNGSVDALKSSLKKVWKEFPQKTLRAAVESYPKRLKAVIRTKGGHID